MSVVGAVMVPHPPVLIPEIGRGEEKKVQATIDNYRKAARFAADLRPETLIISTPHSVMYRDYFHISPGSSADGDFRRYRAGGVRFHVKYDTEFVRELCRLADEKQFPAGTLGERDPSLDQGTMVPLYFLREVLPDVPIVRIGLSGLPLADHYRLGMMIQKAAERLGRRAVYVASGDLSHRMTASGPYGYNPHGPEYDERVMDVMGGARFDELMDFDSAFLDEAAECGHRSFVMMAGALDGLAVKAQRLSHEGVLGVGYGICTYEVTGEDGSRHMLDIWEKRHLAEIGRQRKKSDIYVRLARASAERYVRTREPLSLSEARAMVEQDSSASEAQKDELLNQRAGTFVSIHENGELRGCIGTISPTRSCTAEEILGNAVSASTRDPRFPEIRPEELPYLEITVDVLGKPEPVSSKKELDVRRYGVIVTKGRRRGLLLPDLEGVDSADQQVSIALQKAGLDPDEENYSMERFEVVRHY
ncbi:MAG: AmmeMemoRadiSam system protein A [Lachnospiraceae bacterium]|jgi:AmmeMemoRadiSam system protein A